jgi:hypothetical protein
MRLEVPTSAGRARDVKFRPPQNCCAIARYACLWGATPIPSASAAFQGMPCGVDIGGSVGGKSKDPIPPSSSEGITRVETQLQPEGHGGSEAYC